MAAPPENDEGLQESSMNLDLESVRPFLQRISPLVESGFGEVHVRQVCELVEAMEQEGEEELVFPIRYGGRDTFLRIGVFMDDIDAPDLYFFSPPALATRIDTEFEKFCDEMGM